MAASPYHESRSRVDTLRRAYFGAVRPTRGGRANPVTNRPRAQLEPEHPDAFANMVRNLDAICDWRGRRSRFERLERVRFRLGTDIIECRRLSRGLTRPNFTAHDAPERAARGRQILSQRLAEGQPSVSRPWHALSYPISEELLGKVVRTMPETQEATWRMCCSWPLISPNK